MPRLSEMSKEDIAWEVAKTLASAIQTNHDSVGPTMEQIESSAAKIANDTIADWPTTWEEDPSYPTSLDMARMCDQAARHLTRNYHEWNGS